jgi:DNA-binding transcriptional ArsR family regulator
MTTPTSATTRRIRLRSPKLSYDLDMLKAMSDETRQMILQFLCTPGAGEMKAFSVTEIAENFKLTASTVSHHLQLLRRAQLVNVRRDGKERLYSLNFDVLRKSVQQFADALGTIETTMVRTAAIREEQEEA